MANLSNINGKFVVEQTTGYVGVGTTDPNYPIEVLNASAEIALNASGGSIYRLRSDSTDSFRINKNGVGDRLVIDGSGNSTFAGDVGIGGSPNDALEVAGNSATTHRIRINNANSSGSETLAFVQGTTFKSWVEYNNSNGNFDIWQYTNNNLRFGTNNIERLVIDSSGNLLLNQATSRIKGGGATTGRIELSNSDSKSYMMITGSANTNPNLIYFVNDAAVTLTLNQDNSIKLNAYDSTNNTGTPTYLLGTDASGNVVKTLSSAAPGSLWAASGTNIYNTNSGTVSIGSQTATLDRRFQVTGSNANLTSVQQFGIVNNPTYPTTATSQVFNFYCGPALTSGTTLTSLYNVYLPGNSFAGSTVGNSWAIYQEGSNDKNYFAGNVGIGTTAPTSQLFVNNTADGDKIRWGRSDALVGSVGTFNGVPYIGYQGGAGGGIMFNGSSIEPTLLGSSRSSNTNDIGSVNYKWRNAYFGNQVSAANYIAAAAEGLRINDSAAYVSGYNTAGTQRTGYLQFLNGSGTILIDSEIGNRYIVMALASTAKVGIGTSSPLNKLQVNGDIGIGEINSTRSTNVRFAKNDVNVITFDISVGAVGAWRPGSCWIQVSGAQNGLQEYWSAWYFIRLTHYYLSGVAGQGTPNPSCILDSGGDTSSVDVGVSSTNTSNPQIITITLTDSGGTTNSMVADINCTMQMGINSIT